MPDFHFPLSVRITNFEIADIVLPVFVIIAGGFVFGKIKRIDISPVNDLILYAGAPCLVLSSFSQSAVNLALVGKVFGFLACASALWVAAAFFLSKAMRVSRSVYAPTLVFANMGNMGLPLVLFAFGQEGFQIAVVCMVALALLHYTVGVVLVSPGGKNAFYEIFKLPMIYAALAGIWINAVDYEAPLFIARAVKLLGDIAVPGMIFTLGYRLSEISISGVWLSAVFGVLRVALGFFTAILLVRLFNFSPLAEKVLILQCAMPTAMTCLVLAEKYNAEPEKVASVIAVGTAVSLFVLPTVVWYLTA